MLIIKKNGIFKLKEYGNFVYISYDNDVINGVYLNDNCFFKKLLDYSFKINYDPPFNLKKYLFNKYGSFDDTRKLYTAVNDTIVSDHLKNLNNYNKYFRDILFIF